MELITPIGCDGGDRRESKQKQWRRRILTQTKGDSLEMKHQRGIHTERHIILKRFEFVLGIRIEPGSVLDLFAYYLLECTVVGQETNVLQN